MRTAVTTIAVAAFAAVASGSTTLPLDAQNALTPIDSVPTRQQLDTAFQNAPVGTPLDNLVAIATDDTADVGIRLRAVHALAKYCSAAQCTSSDIAHQSATSVIENNKEETTGSPLLVLRAGIETLGAMRVSDNRDVDVNLLLPLLDHPSRDIRASTAKALQDLCATQPQATAALRLRYSRELTEQVKLAISEALRILGQCTQTP